ncbi:MAG TPA: hypothetical protein PLH18_11995, partial [Clostridia bacterium]|nr:hypothetical protein [Clostridia bacterium]
LSIFDILSSIERTLHSLCKKPCLMAKIHNNPIIIAHVIPYITCPQFELYIPKLKTHPVVLLLLYKKQIILTVFRGAYE